MTGVNTRYSPRESNGEYLDNVANDAQNESGFDNIVFNIRGKSFVYNLLTGFFGVDVENQNSKYIPDEVKLLKNKKHFMELVDEINK